MARNRLESYLEARDPSLDRRLVPLPDKKVVLEKLLEDDDETFCSESSDGAKDTAAQLYLRLRPTDQELCACYKIDDNVFIAKPETSNGSKTTTEKQFTFSGIFDGQTPQHQIYESCIKSSIESETNLTVLTYGTSGSGKTFTLLGDVDNPGIIPRSLENLFAFYERNIHPEPAVKIVNGVIDLLDDKAIEVEENLRSHALVTDSDIRRYHSDLQRIRTEHDFQSQNSPNNMVFIWISFAEIYNEIVYDLLVPIEQDPLRRKKLKISSNNEKVFIKDLTTINVRNSLEAYTLLTKGIKRVTYGSTGINDHSSRSHCIFFINVVTFQSPGTFTHVTHQFCDLAGSERQKKAGNLGNRLKEANSINTSLTVLSRCLHAVHKNQQKKNIDVVPFRESKLTMLLRDPLLGREKITIIVNLSPVQKYFDENLNVLGFSNIAKSITYKPSTTKAANSTRYSWFASHAQTSSSSVLSTSEAEILYEENITLKSEMERMRNEMERQQNEILRLERKLMRQEFDLRKELVEEFQTRMHDQNDLWEKRLKQKETQLELYYEGRIALLKENNKRKPTEDLNDSGGKKSTAVSTTTINLDDSDYSNEDDSYIISES